MEKKDYRRYDGSPDLRRITKLLVKAMDGAQHPDPIRQRDRTYEKFRDAIKSQGPGAADDEIAGYYRGMLRRELVQFWFQHAYDDLLKKRPETSKKKTIKVRGRKVQLQSGTSSPPVKPP
jgi:hypothetical protein